MKNIDYKTYFDKVYGCWLGKCIGGAIGAPYEGMKELLDFEFHPSLIEAMPPNDDLDLQVLWLDVLEAKGFRFTSDDLATAFFERCPYGPGEYAYFKKNYHRGICPPVSGAFNNRYYIEGMGCPIRSEIWACVAPGHPALAAELASHDGVLDHAGNSVYAEQFLAGLEAAAFFESDLDRLLDIGLTLIPRDSRIAATIRDVRAWCRAGHEWKYVRDAIVRDYGHADCTNLFQNMGFLVMALCSCRLDFIETTMTALNCGFDTDCTASTAGAILGILHGAEALKAAHGFPDCAYILGIDLQRRSDRVTDLAEDTCRMGLHFLDHGNDRVRIVGAPKFPPVAVPPLPPVAVHVEYDGIPALGPGETRRVWMVFRNNTGQLQYGLGAIDAWKGWTMTLDEFPVQISPGESHRVEVRITADPGQEEFQERNLFRITLDLRSGVRLTHVFGLTGAALWEVYGPFWHNNVKMPKLALNESYYQHIPSTDANDAADQTRTYHLNTRIDLDREFMTLDELHAGGRPGDPMREPKVFHAHEDRFNVNDLVGFQGPCAVYLVRRLVVPEDREVGILIGHTDAYRLWIDGQEVSRRDTVDWWTAENAHVLNFPLAKGTHTVVVKLIRRGTGADFSLIFCKGGPCTDHFGDFASLNPHAR